MVARLRFPLTRDGDGMHIAFIKLYIVYRNKYSINNNIGASVFHL